MVMQIPHRGEWRRFAAIAVVLTASAMIQGICDVISVSGVVTHAGLDSVLWLWASNALLALTGVSALSLWVDRVARRRLTITLFLTFAGVYVLLWAAMETHLYPAAAYGVLGIVDTVQANMISLAGWALARDLFEEVSAMRLFGLLGSLSYVGTFIGTALTAGSAGTVLAPWLLPISAATGIMAASLIAWLVPPDYRPVTHPQAEADAAAHDTTPLRHLWAVPVFRWLTALVLLNALTWTVMSFGVLRQLDASADGTAAGLERAYGQLRAAGPVVHALVEGVLSAWLLARLGYGGIFLAVPLVLWFNLSILWLVPGVVAAWVATLGLQVVFGAEGGATHALLVRIPAHLRGRASLFMTGSLPQLGYMSGVAVIAVSRRGAAVLDLSPHAQEFAPLMAGTLIASVAFGIGVWLRRLFAADLTAPSA